MFLITLLQTNPVLVSCQFISLGEKMRELLDKNGKRKKKREEKKRGKLLII